ncbi:NADPH-dependent F420 reductase [Mammaliicoccus sp. Dog046]|uniref:NADPH-dependent F420 reductase n=1 Tax=Mammaliicoccus sp. Dog046 TaxID=3034233 RepID=UPI002B259A19|nr:NAD(P)-binding domain-containing protein [Mammaliicoccus sp. Dog046]WQK85111.1 NAD(P)-binding domain-containing protein [Mammaliicoccus sp. Dog046]
MKIGIIGAGPIGATLSHKLVNSGHDVKIADVRSVDRLKDKNISGKAVEVEDVVTNIDVLILSIPTKVMTDIKDVISKVEDKVIIVDTSNYYPFRDHKIAAIEDGEVESEWVSQQIGRDVVKAFNNLLAYTLAEKGSPQGTDNRIAIGISGNNDAEKDIIKQLINEVGFDAVDNGKLSDSWKQQPGTPAYCTELTKSELATALEKANKQKAPQLRDEIMKNFTPDFTHDDTVNLNRKIYNAGS